MGYAAMFGALLFVSLGTGLFKGNLQVMVGNLYDAPELSAKRDSGFLYLLHGYQHWVLSLLLQQL